MAVAREGVNGQVLPWSLGYAVAISQRAIAQAGEGGQIIWRSITVIAWTRVPCMPHRSRLWPAGNLTANQKLDRKKCSTTPPLSLVTRRLPDYEQTQDFEVETAARVILRFVPVANSAGRDQRLLAR